MERRSDYIICMPDGYTVLPVSKKPKLGDMGRRGWLKLVERWLTSQYDNEQLLLRNKHHESKNPGYLLADDDLDVYKPIVT